MNKQEFFEKYNFTEADLTEANITWDELELIAEEYRKNEQSLRDCGKSFIDEYLYDIEKAGIHSYRYRIKELDHLLDHYGLTMEQISMTNAEGEEATLDE
jgi:ppGpp synthetase/RelA/SpoT-type nucleotidyltranferase